MKLKEHFLDLQLAEPQRGAHITIFPLLSNRLYDVHYQTMDDSINRGDLQITEISEEGKVPLLEARNNVEREILLLDSEEIIGAKQNRALNTSILLPRNKRTIIPVSCTESGRWDYNSHGFFPSRFMMPPKVRYNKMKSVSAYASKLADEELRNLQEKNSAACVFYSDQSEVWSNVEDFKFMTGSKSPTSAMKDAMEDIREDINQIIDQFPLQKSQAGVLVMQNNRVTGLDFLSQPKAYSELHKKIISSYVSESVIEKNPRNHMHKTDVARAREFLDLITESKGQTFQSAGEGVDVRYSSASYSGMALIHKNEPIHVSFLSYDD